MLDQLVNENDAHAIQENTGPEAHQERKQCGLLKRPGGFNIVR